MDEKFNEDLNKKQNALPDDIFEPEKETIKGQFPGDKAVRIHRVQHQGIKKKKGQIYEIFQHQSPKTIFGKIMHTLRFLIFGNPVRSDREIHERLTKIKGLAVFGSDNISSPVYASEEIMKILVTAGAGALILNIPITLSVLVLLAVVVFSYQQTINAYPSGGGSYIVAKDNLGIIPGLIAASAIMVGYMLTVSVSVAAGISAMISAFPVLQNVKVLLCIIAILFITIVNLRGMKESGNIFAIPVFIFILSMLGGLGFGIVKYFLGILPSYPHTQIAPPNLLDNLGILLILKAFASGACGLTGVEAVADGVPAFKPPESKNAQKTLVWMAVIFGFMFFSISFLAVKMGILPDPLEIETVVSKVIRGIWGVNFFYYLVQFSTMMILILAANTSYADFPRLASFLARDKFLPSQFGFRGDRLAFNNGILVLAFFSMLLEIIFKGSVTALIPLYTIGVFIAFTASQAGMVARWIRTKEKGWQRNCIINLFGAIITFVVLIVIGVTKFMLGAWVVLVVIPLMVFIFYLIHMHFIHVGKDLGVDISDLKNHPDTLASNLKHYILIPVADFNKTTQRAIAYVKSMSGPNNENVVIQALHVTDDIEAGQKLQEKWEKLDIGIPLIILESPYRAFTGVILRYINALESRNKKGNMIITIAVPEFISTRFWKNFLHSHTALRLKAELLFRPGVVVVSVPYHL